MRKIAILFTLVLLGSGVASAQKNKVQSAYNYLKYDQLDKAQEAIDAAKSHEQTMNDDKTWYYRGVIYQTMYQHEKYGTLSADPLSEAYISFKKASELAPDGEWKGDIKTRMRALGTNFFNQGAALYNKSENQKAIAAFDKTLAINNELGVPATDSLNMFSHLYAAYAAEKDKNSAVAKNHYQQLINMQYNDAKIYSFLANIYKSESDTSQALKTIQEGRTKFPNDNNLVIEELNIYLSTGKTIEAMDRLKLAISKEPKNENLHFALGTLYDKSGDQVNAAASYKKAIELKPDYFDAFYNLGVMYFNQGAELANKANDIAPSKVKEYDEAKKKFEAKFQEAKPFLEEALKLNPEDKNTMISLRQIYARTGEKEKYDKLSKLLGQ